MKHARLALLLPLLPLCACASIVDGGSEKISVNSNPPGANCAFSSNGQPLGAIQTPGTIKVTKTKHDMNIICTKEGYQQASYLNHSNVDQFTFGNIVFGLLGLVGWGIDSASGSDNKYDSTVNLTLPAALAPQAASQPVAPVTAQPLTPVQPSR